MSIYTPDCWEVNKTNRYIQTVCFMGVLFHIFFYNIILLWRDSPDFFNSSCFRIEFQIRRLFFIAEHCRV